MIKHLAAAAAIAIVVIGCSSNTTNPPTSSPSYLPSTAGKYTIHNNVTLVDDGSGGISETEPFTDSVVVTGTKSKSDSKGVSKNAVEHVIYVDGSAQDSVYLSEDGAKIYQLFDLSAATSDVAPIDLGTTWMLVADQNATSKWIAYEDSLSGVQVTLDTLDLNTNIKIQISVRKIGAENMMVDGKTVETIKYETTYAMIIYIDLIITQIPIPITLTSNQWLGKNVGVVKIEQLPVTIEAEGFDESIPVNGRRSTLVRFSN